MLDRRFFQTWLAIVDRMAQALPAGGTERERLVRLQEQISRYLLSAEGQPDEIEADLLALAGERPDWLVAAADGLTSEVFQLFDAEIQRFRRAKEANTLTQKDRATLKRYMEMLESAFASPADRKSTNGTETQPRDTGTSSLAPR
jgi:hypothetical protein